MLPPPFIALIAFSSGLPFLATLTFIVSISSTEWETVTYNFQELKNNKTVITSNTSSIVDYEGNHAGDLLRDNNSKIHCVYNFKGGIWHLCDTLTDKSRIDSGCAAADMVKGSNRCFFFITDYTETKNNIENHGQFVIKMQNNIISCVIVVLLCVAASIIIGIVAIVGKVVPAAMVTGVLYFTAGLFVFFANCIQYIKVDKIISNDEFCYPVVSYPTQLCIPQFMIVTTGWPAILSWIASVLFAFACGFWLYLTRLMRIETAKNML